MPVVLDDFTIMKHAEFLPFIALSQENPSHGD